MRRFTTSSAMVVALACGAMPASITVAGPAKTDPAATEMLRLGLRGVYFVPNEGQWSDSDVQYGLRSRGLDVAFRESALTMHMTREVDESTEASPKRERGGVGATLRGGFLADDSGSLNEPADFERLTFTITFPGSNDVEPMGAKPQSARFNYFVGGEGRRTASDVPSFAEVVYPNLYDGVDLHVMGNDDGVLKYEFHVAPGADYAQLRIAYDGVDSLCIDNSGDLHIKTVFAILADGAPIAWQEDPAIRATASTSRACEEARYSDPLPVIQDPLPYGRGSIVNPTILAHFELCDAHTYRIALEGPVNPARELIIDPDVDWMTYFGGGGTDYCSSLSIDGQSSTMGTSEQPGATTGR